MGLLHRGRKSSILRRDRLRQVLSLTAVVAIGGLGSADIAVAEPSHLPGVTGTLWVTDRNGSPGGLFALDAATGEVITRVGVGLNPIGVVAPRGLGKVYTTNETSNSISVVSKSSRTEVKQISTGAGSRPHHLVQSRGGRFLYAALFDTATAAVIDTRTDEMAGTLAMSTRAGIKTHAVWASNDGTTLYGANTFAPGSQPGTLSAIDVRTGSPLWEVEVGRNPSEVLVTADGQTAYVSVRDDNVVKVLDLTTEPPSIVGSGLVGVQPDTLQLANSGRTLVVALRGTPAQVSLFDTSTLMSDIVSVPGTTTGHQWLAANGRYTFVAVEDSSAPGVAVIDNRSATVVEMYRLPAGSRPHGVFYERSRQK